jgi:hypothetical protein
MTRGRVLNVVSVEKVLHQKNDQNVVNKSLVNKHGYVKLAWKARKLN